MIARQHPSSALLRLASLQDQVLSVEQLRGHGLGRTPVQRIIDEGRWQRIGRGIVYLGEGPAPWPALAWAGVLQGGDQARLGSTSALFAAGVTPSAPEVITVLVPHEQRLRSRGSWRFVRERRGVRDPRTVGDPPSTTLEDATLDAAAELSESEVVALVDVVGRSRRTHPDRLWAAACRREQLRHRSLLRALLADLGQGAESELERRFLHDVERAHALPSGGRQVRHSYGGVRRDIWYQRYRLVVELDGRLGHEGAGRFRDMTRDNRSLLGGDHTLRYGWADVTGQPCAVAWEIGVVLHRLGWSGVLDRCSRCARV